MSFCTNCGAKLSGDTKFCTSCGKQIESRTIVEKTSTTTTTITKTKKPLSKKTKILLTSIIAVVALLFGLYKYGEMMTEK